MDVREQMEAFWAGQRPDQIPYTIYDWEWRHTADDPRWQPLFDLGLGITWHIPTIERHTPGVEFRVEQHQAQDILIEHHILETEVGSIHEIHHNRWRQKFMLETAEDYAVMTHIVRQTELRPTYEAYLTQEQNLGPHEIALVNLGRTPNQTILVDYVGLENYAFHTMDLAAEMQELYEALLEKFREAIELTAAGPGRYVCVLENFTAETLGPRRYADLLAPVYDECFPTLQSSGKIVGTHYDGNLASCREHINQAPIDLIESLTPPPEGDMTLAEARAAWPDKLFWSNLNIACYDLPPAELQALIAQRVAEAAPDGTRLAFEVSEQYPANWFDSMKTVLQTLKEIG